MFTHLPIRRKMILALVLTSGVMMLLMRVVSFAYEYVSFRESTLRQLSVLAEIIASNSTAALMFDNPDDAREILSALRSEPHISAAGLYDRSGNLFATYPDSAGVPALPSVPPSAGHNFAGSLLTFAQPVQHNGQSLGMLYLEFDSSAVLREWLSGSLAVTAGVMALMVLFAYLVARIIQKQITQPVLALAETARVISDQRDYSVRAIKYSQDEIGLLTDAFNQMLNQIQAQNEKIRVMNEGLEQRVVQRTAQLQAANAELEAFSSSVSHDLRAPLRHIDGYAQLVQKRSDHVLDETGRRYLATIVSSSKALGVLIDELLEFSRMGRTELRRSSVDMDILVADVVNDLRPDLQGRQIEWKIGKLPIVHGDPTLLRQVLRNLVGNAIKYTRGREVATIQITQEAHPSDGHVFSIADNGAGFDMAYVDKLFGVFQRLHTNREFEGTGIGLANVRRIIQRHNGRTWAEGRVGEGATFFFTLPAD